MKVSYKSQPLRQNWNQEFPKYWFDNSPLKTHYLNAVSLLIPIAETTVLHTLKVTHPLLKDLELKEQVSEMIAQENWHSYSHRKYNEWLDRIGLPGTELSSEYLYDVIKTKKRWENRFGEKFYLPGIVGGEHNAACLMEYLLERPALLATMHPHFRQAWVWHCIEEIEHKGSSMDMWYDTKETSNRKKIFLKFACIATALRFNYFSIKTMFALLKHDKQLWKWSTLKDGFSFFLGRDGLITKSIIPWLKCLKPSWHPWDHDTRYLINQYQKLTLANALTPEELAEIDIEFQSCVVDIERVIRENNRVKVY